MTTTAAPWTGRWVVERFGVALRTEDGSPLPLEHLVGLALRRNPNRAHLLVSPVLGKHVPADPRAVLDAGRRLGSAVGAVLGGDAATVLGYAETATGLGHAVAAELKAPYLHSTRRIVDGVEPIGGFEEEHSHATSHLLLPDDPHFLARDDVLVLVDDELSTGRTAVNTIRALHGGHPRRRYVVAALVDVRPQRHRAVLGDLAAELGVTIEAVALGRGAVELPDDLAARAAAETRTPAPDACRAAVDGLVQRVDVPWPATVRESARHGFRAADHLAAGRTARATAQALAGHVHGRRLLVLGCEELMYAPALIAAALADLLEPGTTVRLSSTTRSPVHVVDDPGYPIRTALTFPAHDATDTATAARFAYNVAPAAGSEPYTDIVLIVDDAAAGAALTADGGLVDRLAGVAERVLLVVLPTHAPGRDG